MAKFKPIGTHVVLDPSSGQVKITGPENPITPYQAMVFALDILSVLSTILEKNQEVPPE